MRQPALPALCFLLVACQDYTPLPDPLPDPRLIGPPAQADLAACGGNAVLPLLGQNVAVLPEAGGWGTLRVIYPGMAVTEDFSETRLNVQVDAAGVMLSLSCG